jgi:hypothetical protein
MKDKKLRTRGEELSIISDAIPYLLGAVRILLLRGSTLPGSYQDTETRIYELLSSQQ